MEGEEKELMENENQSSETVAKVRTVFNIFD